jgi:hypothetical protein
MTWTTIPDSSLEPGKPIRSIDALALRDNPAAIANGDQFAPRIRGKGLARLSEMQPIAGLVSGGPLRSAALGTDEQHVRASTSGAAFFEIATNYNIIAYFNVLRFKASHTGATFSDEFGGGTVTGFLRLVKNGVLVQEFTTQSTGFVERTVDLQIEPGDNVRWEIKSLLDGYVTQISNVSVSAINVWVGRPGYISSFDDEGS